ncbi:hypothetical protein HOLleu_13802 [Holothuria leucospilota]|uniref:Uncharacterized protein n=1 Tax=Holothuria leucospilota TaxID=206669 RepID=A0A9Q1C875_HOLLE|nr:hypothetical protein HOLleu_13802 [Holothuria leucospilota]
MMPSNVILGTFLIFMSQFVLTCWGQVQCLGCTSEKFLNTDFSDLDVFEDPECERGDSLSKYWITCSSSEVCYVIDGIASYYVQGFGVTDTKLVIRSCIDRFHFPSTSTCLRGTDADTFVRSFNHQLEIGDDVILASFDGTACPCQTTAYCNDQQISPVVVRRPHTPSPGAGGLQCATCLDIDFHGSQYDYYNYDNPSCEAGDLKDPDVFYHTCSGDGACVVIDGVITELGIPYSFFQRVCVHGFLDIYPRTRNLTCLPSDEAETIVPIILLSEDDYYFGYDLTFEGSLCYCTSDLCNLFNKSPTITPAILSVVLSVLLGVVMFYV